MKEILVAPAPQFEPTIKDFQDEIASLKAQLRAELLLFKVFGDKDVEGGKVVKMADAKQCIDLYLEEMEDRGIMDASSPFPHPLIVSDTLLITKGIKFNGVALRRFIVDRLSKPGTDPDNLHFRFVLGIYTEEFLRGQGLSQALIQLRKERVAVFIVPYVKDAAGGVVPFDDDEDGYDLGGLEP